MAPPSLLPLRVLNACTREEFGAAVHLLFEPVPVLVDHVGNNELHARRPYATYAELVDEAARALGVSASGNATSNGPIQRVFTRHQLVDVVNAHPRIGAAAQTLSALSRLEQGVTAATTIATPEQAATTPTTSLADTLRTLNDAYEQRYGFKFVVFVNGRTREEIVPVMRARIESAHTSDQELEIGLSEMVAIARDRLRKLGDSV